MTLWPSTWQLDPASWKREIKDPLPCWPEAPLNEMLLLFQHCDVGSTNSLPSLGRRLLYTNWTQKQHALPPRASVPDLKALPAPRFQRLRRAALGECGKSWDRPAAYPHFSRKLPSGTTVRLLKTLPPWITCWFRQCEIQVHSQLSLGPFPVRVENRTIWPVQPGVYRTWLWSDQATDSLEAGCTIYPGPGWGWHQWTDDASPWVDYMLALRSSAPTSACNQLIKLATNAAIGSLAAGLTYKKQVPTDRASKKLVPTGRPLLDADGHLTQYDILEVPGQPSMIHWQRYIEMRCAQDAYRRALPYAEKGLLLAIEVDKIVYAERIRLAA